MKVFKLHFLFIALTLLAGISLTSCFNSDDEDPIDGAMLVRIRSSIYGSGYFEDASGNTYIPTQASINAMEAAGFSMTNTTMAYIMFKIVDSPTTAASSRESSTTTEPQEYYIEVLSAAPYDGEAVLLMRDEASVDAVAPETAPVVSLKPTVSTNYGSTVYEPSFFDSDILMLPTSFRMKYSTEMVSQHKLRLVCYMSDMSEDDTRLVLYMRHDKGEDTSLEYLSVVYYGYNLAGAISQFRNITKHDPQEIVIRAHISETGAELTTDYTDYVVDYSEISQKEYSN